MTPFLRVDLRAGAHSKTMEEVEGKSYPRPILEAVLSHTKKYDVDPNVPGGRNATRLVTGSDGSAYYTTDHYNTFTRIQ